MPTWREVACIVGLLSVYVACDVSYGRVWESRLALALYTADHAPLKPNALNEVALSLMEQRRFSEAQTALDIEDELLRDPLVPPQDRIDSEAALQTNRLILARVSGH